MIGGLLAVVWTESIQSVLLLIGAVCISGVGYVQIGGWSELSRTLAGHAHPLASTANSGITWGTGNFLTDAGGADYPAIFRGTRFCLAIP